MKWTNAPLWAGGRRKQWRCSAALLRTPCGASLFFLVDQKQQLSPKYNPEQQDRNAVVKRWSLTHCAGSRATLQLLINEAALTFNCHQLQFSLKLTTWPQGFKQPNVAFNACSLPLVQSSLTVSPINATSTEPGCCSVLKTAVPLRKIKLSNGYALLCCC